MELNDELRNKLAEIKHYLKSDKYKKWPLTTKLIYDYHITWQQLYGPLWSELDTSNDLEMTLQTIKAAIKLIKSREKFPDIVRVKNKKYALHLINTYSNTPDILRLKILQEVQRKGEIPTRIIRNENYRRETYV